MIIDRLKKKIGFLSDLLSKSSVAIRRARYEELKNEKLKSAPKALAGYGYKVFSQSDEDGIINEIFRRIGLTNKTFVEFGVGDGLENNTVALVYEGWSGLWIEGSGNFCERIGRGFASAISSGQLRVINSFVTPENINELISREIKSSEIDLLSVDIDGNDAHVFDKITCINPRVIVFEYNAKFGPSLSYCMAFDGSYAWKKTDRFGASLKYFEDLLRGKGYSCVGCNIVGTNAFFVRDDLLDDHFLAPYTSEKHFEPARYELVGLPSGHPCSHDTFDTRLVM
ncbi:MAG: hypothetical protein Q7U91_06520 [Sideroxyarcus sp.]|nr:hypothetical protein [Sideroxyarcus sp.]